jgi:hypothetical protein
MSPSTGTAGQLPLGRFAALLDNDLRGDVPPVDDRHLRHDHFPILCQTGLYINQPKIRECRYSTWRATTATHVIG